jgi:hypothetical protein
VEPVRARVVQNDCPECVYALLAESKNSFPEGLPLEGEIVNVPEHWLDRKCPHGRLGIKFRLEVTDPDAPREPERAKKSVDVEFEATDSRIDATNGPRKNNFTDSLLRRIILFFSPIRPV